LFVRKSIINFHKEMFSVDVIILYQCLLLVFIVSVFLFPVICFQFYIL
jgi:hypothetical protein